MGIAGIVVSLFLFLQARRALKEAQQEAVLRRKQLEIERKENLAALQEEIHRKRLENQTQLKRSLLEAERQQASLVLQEERLKTKEKAVDDQLRQNAERQKKYDEQLEFLKQQEHRLKQTQQDLLAQLETVSALSQAEARALLVKEMEEDALLASKKLLHKIEEDTQLMAKERATQILVDAMQRQASEQVVLHAAGTVYLPNEELKGRIIGKEGRNIKALEMATGMEFVIGESPETVTISGFHPIRREIARKSLERLIQDGRINPTKIEETVSQCEREVEEMIQEQGRHIVTNFNLRGLKDEIVTLLGKLHFRTSFSQNVLIHSVEVGKFARVIAEELGMPNPEIALRGGLLHDIGKALSTETEGPHALIGADVAKRCGEDPRVVNAIAAHHEEVPFASLYAPIVTIADTLSAARPGARRETLSTYIKRLEKLEEIAQGFLGVKRAFALQAGREVRVIVEEEQLDDDHALNLARTIARKIETDMQFPGQIKVNVIREKRAIEYAR